MQTRKKLSSPERADPRERKDPMCIGVFGCLRHRLQSRFPKPGAAGSNPAEGASETASQGHAAAIGTTHWRRSRGNAEATSDVIESAH